MTSYGQFCPIAKAMEILDERWTMLIVRELLLGSTKFSELRRGVPRMSPTLLSRRLRTLARSGVIERHDDGGAITYSLTRAGQELWDVVQLLSVWGVRWIGELGQQDVDPHLLFWDMRRTIPAARWPSGRTVLAIHFTDLEPRHARWWLVVSNVQRDADMDFERDADMDFERDADMDFERDADMDFERDADMDFERDADMDFERDADMDFERDADISSAVDVCDVDPGFEVDASLRVDLVTLTKVWRGDLAWERVLRSGSVELVGPHDVTREVPTWLGQSRFAAIPRPGGADTGQVLSA